MAMVKSKKYTGVYYNELENKDKVFYFNPNPDINIESIKINS